MHITDMTARQMLIIGCRLIKVFLWLIAVITVNYGFTYGFIIVACQSENLKVKGTRYKVESETLSTSPFSLKARGTNVSLT